jgi:hypothetical protein
VEVLSQEGLLTPADADQMRVLSDKRNRLVHGDLGIEISSDELQQLMGVLRQLSTSVQIAGGG